MAPSIFKIAERRWSRRWWVRLPCAPAMAQTIGARVQLSLLVVCLHLRLEALEFLHHRLLCVDYPQLGFNMIRLPGDG